MRIGFVGVPFCNLQIFCFGLWAGPAGNALAILSHRDEKKQFLSIVNTRTMVMNEGSGWRFVWLDGCPFVLSQASTPPPLSWMFLRFIQSIRASSHLVVGCWLKQ